ncbi:VOC family protein [Bradyrhizobium sp. AZCC 2230]|uniref:VOC family protein n=1 Tax=Bradyrhizobium sp. AZCC 2230 TaxID=3117021 RepID=UPI002FF1712A
MLDHVVIAVSNYTDALAFYRPTLAALGIEIAAEWETSFAVGYPDQEPQLGFRAKGNPVTPQHIALRANSEDEVHRFYQAALRAGGTDKRALGPRPHYDDNYLAAFVIDRDGHNIEAVFRRRHRN